MLALQVSACWLGSVFAPGGDRLGTLISNLFGYSFALPPEFYPANYIQAFGLFAALAFFAPVRGFLFRGVIQRGYERRGPWTAIMVVGLFMPCTISVSALAGHYPGGSCWLRSLAKRCSALQHAGTLFHNAFSVHCCCCV
jgi:hypothetical protein